MGLPVVRAPEETPDDRHVVLIVLLPPDERLRADLTAIWLGPLYLDDGLESLGELLREEAGRWRSAEGPEELARLFESATDPAERRQILVEVFRRQDEDEDDMAIVWRLLRSSKDREAHLLLQRISYIGPSDEEVAELYRSARSDEEREKALWIAGAAQSTEQVGELAPLKDVVRAFLSSPSLEARFNLGDEIAVNLAGSEDLPLMLEALYAGNELDAEILAPYFAEHPVTEAVPALRRALRAPFQEDSMIAEALAASEALTEP